MRQDEFLHHLQSLARNQAEINHSPLFPAWFSPLGAFVFNHTFLSLTLLSFLFTFLTFLIFYA